ncbi:DUF4405 domain-containing protein [Thermodesulfobacteriota bacterium]
MKMNMRKITALTALISFLVLVVNSIVLYIVPHGRVSRWANWRFWGLDKDEWVAQHIIIGLLFLIAIFLHIYYNWKPIVSSLKNKAKQLKIFTKEFNVALIITIICTVGAYVTIPPFNWVLDLSESLKEAAAVKYGDPPYGHAELSTLKSFIRRTGLNLAESIERLRKAGIKFENEKQTLLEIAKINKISPQQVYLAMKPVEPVEEAGKPKKMPDSAIAGTGKRSAKDLCRMYGLDITTIMKGLVDYNISATADMSLRAIAEQNDIGPRDIYDIIKKIVEAEAASPRVKATKTIKKGERPKIGVHSGLGRMTLAEVCETQNLDQTAALKKLANKGIKAQSSDKLRALANKYNIPPIELYEIMK